MAKSKKKPTPKPKAQPKPTVKPEPKKKDVDYGAPEVIAAYDAESIRLFRQSRKDIEEARDEYKALKEQAADKKKEAEVLQKQHEELEHERDRYRGQRPRPVQLEMFPDEPKAKKEAKQQPVAETKKSWVPEHLWKEYPIARLVVAYGLEAEDADLLAVGTFKKAGVVPCPIKTWGDLEAFRSAKADGKSNEFTDLKGIGPAVAKRIEAALTGLNKDWPVLEQPFAAEKGYKRADSEESKEPPAGSAGVDQGSGNGEGEATIPFPSKAV